MKPLVAYTGDLRESRFRVAIFGSSRIRKEDKLFKETKILAKKLGEKGIDIVTGGGPGLMEAATEGHREGGKNVRAYNIGLGIDLPKEQGFNRGVEFGQKFPRFSSRLDKFMLLSNAIIVEPGGVGTLLEFFYAWQLVQVHHAKHIPIILIGKQWPGLIKWLETWPLRTEYFVKEDLHLLFLAKDYKEALKIVDLAHEEFKKGKRDFCIIYKAYKLK